MSSERLRRRLFRVESLETRQLLDGAGLAASLGEGEGEQPDFVLNDVNSSSATFDQSVSPRDYLGQTSAWYFGHST